MDNYIGPTNHPESYLTGSTVESMIDKHKELGLNYCAITDQGHLSSALKGYIYASKKEIQPIIGMELFFKDDGCEIIQGTPSEKIRYFKLVVHAKDQEAYQKLVKLCSEDRNRKIWVGEVQQQLYNWNDLIELSKYNVTVTTADIEGMISKHLLVNQPNLAFKYYQKLKEIFKDNLYISIMPHRQDQYWNTMVEIKLEGDKTIYLPAQERIETDRYNKSKVVELTYEKSQHSKIRYIYVNKIRYKIKKEHQFIKSAKLINDFIDLPSGDIQTKANKILIGIAKKFNDFNKLLIDNYAFYSNKEDKVVQNMKLGHTKRVYQSQYIASTEDVYQYLNEKLSLSESEIKELVQNSYNWASNFDNFELKYDYKLVTPDSDPKKMILDIIKRTGRMKWDDERYVQQFKDEFNLLTNNGLLDLTPYFLPIVDVYKYYEENGYLTGPARGSAGGFLISYLMGITHIDPIKYELSSSRFLTLDRVKQGNLPDIDCDLETRTPLVGNDGNSGYLFKKYGNHAAQVSTRNLLRIKSAILDANRFVNDGTVEDEIAQFAKSLPNTPQGVSDKDFVFGYEDNGTHVEGLIEQNEDLQKYATNRPEEWNIVKRALSLSRQNSRHACAYIISNSPVEDTVPIMEVGGVKRVTQPEHKQCEWAGLMKYDFLVVSALKDINLCLKYINKKHEDNDLSTGLFNHQGQTLNIWDLPEDENVFKMLWEGKTETVFQLNSTTATPLVKKIKPQSVLDCAVITSLGRPGPLDFKDPDTGRKMPYEYAERKKGNSKSRLPILNELIPETYGILVFQEQVTKIARELGQMNVTDAENVRIGMGKKKIKLLNSLKPSFIKGASEKVGEETAEEVWSMMRTFARYGFNKAHATAYSVISYACAYLKYYYPLEWWASVLSNAEDKEINEVFYKYVKDIVLPPDINTSTEQMEVDYNVNKIRNKLSMISGISSSSAEKIMANRPYKDIVDFARKKPCGPKITKKLIHIGVLDSLFEKDCTLEDKIYEFDRALKVIEHEKKLKKYDEKIENEADKSKIDRIKKNKEKMIEKGPADPQIDEEYAGLTPKKDFIMKKSAFPTMNLDLMGVLIKDSKHSINKTGSNTYQIEMPNGFTQTILKSEYLQQIDSIDVNRKVYCAVPGYVMEAREFPFKNNTRKALKLIIDSSGYISEKVLWPDYNTGELKYPESLRKGAIAWFVYYKKPGKPYTNIIDVAIEEPPIDFK